MFANRVAYHQQGLGEVHPVVLQVPSGAGSLSAAQLLDRIDTAIGALNGAEAIVWTQAYCDNLAERDSLVQRIALSACKMGNDPHNQEIAQCMLMDFGTNRQPDRDRFCWPPPITPPCTANTATRKSLRAASATPWG